MQKESKGKRERGERDKVREKIDNKERDTQVNIYTVCFFIFMWTKVFVHLTHLKSLQISQTNLKILVWS